MKSVYGIVVFFGFLFSVSNSHAQVQAHFIFEGVANCQQPAIRNVPIRVTGVGKMSTDRSASLQTYSALEGVKNYDVKLGDKPTAASNGSASLRVLGRNSLRSTREYPNNYVIIDLRIVGNQCQLQVKHQLKPGKRQYTFEAMGGIAYCDRPTTIKTSCSAI